VTQLRNELSAIVDKLATANQATGKVTLDALGDAIGVLAVSVPEIDDVITRLEARGIDVVAPQNERGEEHLRKVLTALRALTPQLGRKPTTGEIAAHAGLSAEQVRYALLLSQVMQR
jgi:2-hydroxychromene-2-carboxylate isomerase